MVKVNQKEYLIVNQQNIMHLDILESGDTIDCFGIFVIFCLFCALYGFVFYVSDLFANSLELDPSYSMLNIIHVPRTKNDWGENICRPLS
jgi:hypothetical protein